MPDVLRFLIFFQSKITGSLRLIFLIPVDSVFLYHLPALSSLVPCISTSNFSDQSAEILAEIIPKVHLFEEFLYQNPVDVGVEDSISFCAHQVNPIRHQTEGD